MRLTNKIKDTILDNTAHLNDDIYGMTTKEMKRNAEMYMRAEVSLDSGIEEQTRMLEEHPDYCVPSNRVKVWFSDDESDWQYLAIERSFAQKQTTDRFGSNYSVHPEFRFSRFSEAVKKQIILYTDRRQANSDMQSKVNDALYRCTTVKQLIAKCPEAAVFFDEDEEFRVPDWKD